MLGKEEGGGEGEEEEGGSRYSLGCMHSHIQKFHLI